MECIPAELGNQTYYDNHADGSGANLTSFDIVYDTEHRYATHNATNYHNGYHHSNNNLSFKTEFSKDGSSQDQLYEQIEYILYSYVIVAICAFGLLGNILNLIVLTSKGLQKTMDRMEKSAHCGLVAMAVSDMCFCLGMHWFHGCHGITGCYDSGLYMYAMCWLPGH